MRAPATAEGALLCGKGQRVGEEGGVTHWGSGTGADASHNTMFLDSILAFQVFPEVLFVKAGR